MWTQGSSSKCLGITYELRDRHGALGQSDLSGADQGPRIGMANHSSNQRQLQLRGSAAASSVATSE